MTLAEIIQQAEAAVSKAPEYNSNWYETWDYWFQVNSIGFRHAIGRLIMNGGGTYAGIVGDHSLELAGIFVVSEDGYRGLLVQWLAAAKSALEHQAVPA